MRQRTRTGFATCVLLVLGAVLPSLAAAHLYLVGSDPADGAHLTAVPREIRLRFSEPPEIAFTRLELLGPDGSPVRLSEPSLSADEPNLVVVLIEGRVMAGPHTLAWRTTSVDGHPVSGRIAFLVDEEAEGLAAAVDEEAQVVSPVHHDPTAFPEADGFAAGSPGYVAVRWLTFVGLLGVIGVVAFKLFVLGLVRRRQSPDGLALLGSASRRSATVGLAFALLLLVAVLARLYAQSLALHGAEAALQWESAAAILSQTTWGWGWILQAAATGVVLTGFAIAKLPRGSLMNLGWALAALGTLGLSFTPALAGHAVAAPENTWLAVLSDGLHVLGAGGWLGSLLAVVTIGIPVAMRLGSETRGGSVAVLVNAFSPTALFFAALVVVTGVVSASVHLESFAELWRSDYGRTLLLKLGVLSLVFGTGAYNWLRVRPTLGDDEGAHRLGRSAGMELAVGAAVLLITAVLVATPPPMDMQSSANQPVIEASQQNDEPPSSREPLHPGVG